MNEIGSGSVPSNSSKAAASSSANEAHQDTPEAIAKAASQFEALLIGQLLQSGRGSDGEGWMGTDENDAGSTLTEMSEQALSTALASRGGLGLGTLITKGLQKTVDETNRVKQEG
jgi:Rod binding domain-containing protein